MSNQNMLILEDEDGAEFVVEAFTRNELTELLANQTVLVSFRKVENGRYRLMYCTRDLGRIPPKDHPNGVGMSYDPVKAGVVPVYDLIKRAWRSFKIRMVRRAEPKTINFLMRLLQRRKYTKDRENPIDESFMHGAVLIEATEIPMLYEGNFQYELTEADDNWLTTVLGKISSKSVDLADVASKAADFFKGEMEPIIAIPSKLSAKGGFLRKYVHDVLAGRNISPERHSAAGGAMKNLLKYIGLGFVIFLPTPPGGSVLSIMLLRTIQRITTIPIFPDNWAKSAEEVRNDLLSFKEMASGAVGGGALGQVEATTFRQKVTTNLRIVRMKMARGTPLRKYGNVDGVTVWVVLNDADGIIFGTLSKEPGELAADDIDSVVFTAQLVDDFHMPTMTPINSMQTLSVLLPHIRPSHQRMGIASKIYGILGNDMNVLADNDQSRQGRYLWDRIVRERLFKFVYVVDAADDDIIDEISGDVRRFRELMDEADPDIRFVGTNVKQSK